MTLALKILNTALILFALYTGIKQGWAMLIGNPEMIHLFSKWHIGKADLMGLGICTMLGSLSGKYHSDQWGDFKTYHTFRLTTAG